MAIYVSSISFDYVLDDQIVISENKFVQKGVSGIGDILTTEGFVGYFGDQRQLVIGERYRPLSLVMFALEQELTNKPWLGHLMNVLLYALLVFVLFSLFKRILSSDKKAILAVFIGALLYTVHPVHVEVIANIKGRDEILVTLFYLSTLYIYLNAHKKAFSSAILVGVLTFLAAMSKEQGVTLLVIAPLTALLFKSWTWKDHLVKFTPVLLGVVGYFALRFNALGYLIPAEQTISSDLMNNPFFGMNTSEEWGTIFYTLLKYIGLLVFPHPLTHDYYPFHIPVTNIASATAIFSLLIYALGGVLALLWFKKRPWWTWAFALFLITLIPAANIFFTVGTFMNERFLFLPSVGACFASGVVLSKLYHRSPMAKTITLGLAIPVFIALTLKTVIRLPDWKNAKTLNQSAIKVSKNSARINMFVATDYFNEANQITDRKKKMSRLEKAKFHLLKSVRIYPLYGSANNMLSGTCAEQFKMDGDIDKLLECFEQVATHRPDTEYLNQFLTFLKERGDFVPELVDFYIQTGYNRLYAEKENFPYALVYLREANKLAPGNKELYKQLASTYFAFGTHLQEHPDPKYPTPDIIESGRYFANKARE